MTINVDVIPGNSVEDNNPMHFYGDLTFHDSLQGQMVER